LLSFQSLADWPSQRRVETVDLRSILWQIDAMTAKLKTVHITLTPQIAELLEAEVASGRFSNVSIKGVRP